MKAEYCYVANDECDNPPGYGTASGACRNAEPPRVTFRCADCGQPVCRNCRKGLDMCPSCQFWKAAHRREADRIKKS